MAVIQILKNDEVWLEAKFETDLSQEVRDFFSGKAYLLKRDCVESNDKESKISVRIKNDAE
ncbi:MAG: hypothetical protein KBT11_10615 [Treponema sp.]|nr:hypothetical protein [Candidatus Treponema equifaecale]